MGGLVEELLTERCLGIRRFCHYQQATGILIDSVNQAHLWVIGVVTLQVFQVPGDGIYKCATEIATPGMNHHTCRLIDHHQVVIFIHHLQRDILWFDGGIIMRTIEHQCDHIARTYLIITFYGFVVNMDETSISSLLNAITARMRLMFRQILIDTHRLLPLVHLHTEVFIELPVGFARGVIYQFNIVEFILLYHYSEAFSSSLGLSSSIMRYSGSTSSSSV